MSDNEHNTARYDNHPHSFDRFVSPSVSRLKENFRRVELVLGWDQHWPMYRSDAVNGHLVGRFEASRLGSWYEGYAAWDVGNVGLPGHMHEVRACTEASEQQVQRVG